MPTGTQEKGGLYESFMNKSNKEEISPELFKKNIMLGLDEIRRRGQRITIFGHVFKIVKVKTTRVVLRYENRKIKGESK